MKCIEHKSTLDIIRVSDEVAAKKVHGGDWVYCPKSAWKNHLRESSRLVEDLEKEVGYKHTSVER